MSVSFTFALPPPILPNFFFVFELKSSFSRPKVLKRQPEVGQVLSLPMTQHRKQYQGAIIVCDTEQRVQDPLGSRRNAVFACMPGLAQYTPACRLLACASEYASHRITARTRSLPVQCCDHITRP